MFQIPQNVQKALNEYALSRNKDFIIKGTLGSGDFSTVYELLDTKTKIRSAVKVVSTINKYSTAASIIEYTEAEINSLKKCKECDYVVDILDHFVTDFENDERIYLIFMPVLIPAYTYLEESEAFSENRLFLTECVAKALEFVHSKKILHRDVALKNIFFHPDKKIFVLGDFGVSKTKLNQTRPNTVIGTHVAPEIILKKDLQGRFNSDIYSLGITTIHAYGYPDIVYDQKKVEKELLNRNMKNLILLLIKATDPDPAIRYQTASEFLQAIENFKNGNNNNSEDIKSCVNALLKNNISKASGIAEKGFANGNVTLANLYAYIQRIQHKPLDALEILGSVKNGNHITEGLIGIIGYREDQTTREFSEKIRKAADNGFAPAQYLMGRWLTDGQSGFEKDPDNGAEYLYQAAISGFRPALYYYNKHLKHRKNSSSVIANELISIFEDMNTSECKDSHFAEDMIKAIGEA